MNRENSIQDTRPYPLPCPATRVNGAGVTEHCTRGRGHDGEHHDGPCEGWTDEPEEPLSNVVDEIDVINERLTVLEERVDRILQMVDDGLTTLLEGLAALRNRGARRERAAAADDGLEPYCRTCTEPIGHFLGHEGWWHWRGEGTPESKTELYDAGHPIVVAWREPGAESAQ